MKIEDFNPLWYNVFARKQIPSRKDEVLMQKIVPIKCPKCNNKDSFYLYGKDKDGYQKYLCRKCNHQFAPDRPVSKKVHKYPRCPVCGKATFLHHDYEYYSNSVVVIKSAIILCLFLNLTIYCLHLCLRLLGRMILSVCVILCI